jgi:alanine racemase
LIQSIKEKEHVVLEGAFTHLSTAGSNDNYYKMQVDTLKEFDTEGLLLHVNNSAGMLAYDDFYDAGRLGIAMYGLRPYEGELPVELKQAFSLHAKITNVKRIEEGEAVGYGATFIALKPEYIATIAIGYADGWIRAHKGREVCINGKRYKTIGNVCMDQLMILVDETVQLGDVVELINDDITVDEVAEDMNTINYEVTCSISDRVPRVFKRDGKKIKEQNYRF